MTRRTALAVLGCLAASAPHLQAIVTPMSRADIERAAALARWPRSDADRARFHRRYVTDLHGVMADSFAVTRIEVITEFRRLELIAEEHARANDTFGRGSLRDAKEALAPWRGRVTVAVRIEFTASTRYLPAVPGVTVAFDGLPRIDALDSHTIPIYSGEESPTLVGGTVETVFDAATLARVRQPLAVRYEGRELTRLFLDFTQLD
jgi:hypothetical protein